MAKLYPSYELFELESKITDATERFVYKTLMNLPDSYEVIHSSIFYPEHRDEGETDFIILHPNLGMMLIEIKGGEIEYRNKQWYRAGEKLRRDPITQVKEAMYFYRDKYSKVEQVKFNMPYTYCICFPHTRRILGDLPIKKERIFLQENLFDIEKTIKAAFAASKEIDTSTNFNNIIKVLKDKVFCVSGAKFIQENLGEWIEKYYEHAEIIFTEEQERILSIQAEEKRILTFGPAGSGKTIVAIEKAKRLISKNKKVLFACFNMPLGEYIKYSLNTEKSPSTIAGHYHDIARRILAGETTLSSIPHPNYKEFECLSNPDLYYNETVPELLLQYSETILSNNEKYDALIIDEGQDFSDLWLLSLKALLKEGEDNEVYVFADEIQSIRKTESSIQVKKLYKDVFGDIFATRLSDNLRNTEKIHELLEMLNPIGYKGKAKISGGKKIEFIKCSKLTDQRKGLENIITELLREGIKPEQIVILSPYSMSRSSLAGRKKIAGYNIISDHALQDSAIRYQTIQRFKGLEADVVLMIDIQYNNPYLSTPLLYVGCSRAKYLLYIFHNYKSTNTFLNSIREV